MISPTLRKLRYQAGVRAYVGGAPAAFEAEMAGAPEIERLERPGQGLGVVQAFFTRRSQLQRELPRLRDALAERGILWICYPRSSALGTDLNRQVSRTLAARAGLRTIGAIPIDAVWTALRCERASSLTGEHPGGATSPKGRRAPWPARSRRRSPRRPRPSGEVTR